MALELAPAHVELERRGDGSLILRNTIALEPGPRCVSDALASAAANAPERTFLAERDEHGELRRLSYAAAWNWVRALASSLLRRGLVPGEPLLVLAPNSTDHALVALAAMHVGIPVSPVSLAYATAGGGSDFERLRAVTRVLQPSAIYVSPGLESAADAVDRELGRPTLRLDPATVRAAERGATSSRAEALAAALGPDTAAKVLFTSGSTGEAKGVINTQRMLCTNQVAIRQLWPFLKQTPPVLVDWLPWNHTFGGNFDLGLVLFNAGTMLIDEGKPTPELVGASLTNLRECAPTVYFNVPRGFDAILPHLEADEDLSRHFFSRLQAIFYAGASLPQSAWERLEVLAARAGAALPFMCSGWGATETAPCSTLVHFPIARAGVIGNPVPGTEIMLRPDGDKFELRVRGPNVTPGYWRAPELDAAAFDDEGFYRIGDAGRLEDPERPEAGLVFDGRVAEDFKLTTGTWVRVGALRLGVVAATTPVVADALVTGHDREDVGALLFLSVDAARELVGESNASAADLARHPEVRARVLDGLRRHNAEASGSSKRIARAAFATRPASLEAGEITDKGYLVQRRLLDTRAEDVERMHAPRPTDEVLLP